MLDKEDYISRKVRYYLSECEQCSNTWSLYCYIKDTLFYDEWVILNLKPYEQRALEKALEDWSDYKNGIR